jgi:hypothetical protein
MKSGRRLLLKGAGIAVVVAAGGVGWRAWDQHVLRPGRGPAYEPWRDWADEDQPLPLKLVAAAILAANPHNSQPWRFRVTESQIDLYADRSRNIGTIDPFLREMHIGLGCALENLVLAANAHGHDAHVTTMPDGDGGERVAQVAFAPGSAARSPLFTAIPSRHTYRGACDLERGVPASVLQGLGASAAAEPALRVVWFDQPARRDALGRLIIEATEAIIADREQSADSAKWFREDWQAIQAHRDGITIDAQSLPPLVNAMAKILPPPDHATADRYWLDATRERHVGTAPAFGLLVTPDAYALKNCLTGGRVWQRLHLAATLQGLAVQPLNQPSERADRERQLGIEPRFGRALAALVADAAWQPLMPFRVGYPLGSLQPSPRRPVSAVVA